MKGTVILYYNEENIKETPYISPNFYFKEIIPSFNIHNDHFYIQIKFIDINNKESKWFDFGYWYFNKKKERILKDEKISIDIDLITSKKKLKACKLKFISNEKLKVNSIALSFSDEIFEINKIKDDGYIPKPIFLNIPFRSQMKENPEIAQNICSSTSVCAVAEYYGINIKTEEFANITYDSYYKMFGLWWRSIQTAHKFGLNGFVRYFESFRDVEEYLKSNIPVISCISYKKGELTGSKTESSLGHVTVICGFDDNGDVICCDPAEKDEKIGVTIYKRNEYAKAWFSSAGGVGYILTK